MPEKNATNGIVIIGRRRAADWPESVPAAPHPCILRIEESETADGRPKKLLRFDRGITGYETYEIDERFDEELRKPGCEWSVCAGGGGWDKLTFDGVVVVEAMDALLSDQPKIWTAHVSEPILKKDENGNDVEVGRKNRILVDETLSAETTEREADRHFERLVGIDPDRDKLRAMFDRTPKKHVHQVMRTPAAFVGKGQPFQEAEKNCRERMEAFNLLWREKMETERNAFLADVAAKRTGELRGKLVDKANFGRGDERGVRGTILTDAGSRIPFVAFGAVADQFRRIREFPSIRVSAAPMNKNETDRTIKIFAVEERKIEANVAAKDGRDR